MIAVYDFLWLRLADYAAKYQSGTDAVSAFNSKLAEVQIEIFNDFEPHYASNEAIRVLLSAWVREQAGATDINGFDTVGTAPEVTDRIISAGVTAGTVMQFAIPQVSESELIAITRIPQRKPNFLTKNVYYRFNLPDQIQLYPPQIITYYIYYLIYPLLAEIAFTYSTTADEDIMTYDPTGSTDLAWPESASNLILYKMLEKYGVSVRENLLQEYSKYGLTQTASVGEGVKV